MADPRRGKRFSTERKFCDKIFHRVEKSENKMDLKLKSISAALASSTMNVSAFRPPVISDTSCTRFSDRLPEDMSWR